MGGHRPAGPSRQDRPAGSRHAAPPAGLSLPADRWRPSRRWRTKRAAYPGFARPPVLPAVSPRRSAAPGPTCSSPPFPADAAAVTASRPKLCRAGPVRNEPERPCPPRDICLGRGRSRTNPRTDVRAILARAQNEPESRPSGDGVRNQTNPGKLLPGTRAACETNPNGRQVRPFFHRIHPESGAFGGGPIARRRSGWRHSMGWWRNEPET